MDFDTFQNLSRSAVAAEVQRANATVCVFPVNGTRRWFLLEHPDAAATDYIELNSRRHVELYQLLFDHGIDTLLAPIFEPVMLKRGDAYRQQFIATGLSAVATNPIFTRFYQDYQVRVRFYGDYRKIFPDTECADVPGHFDQIMDSTREYRQRRLFYGVSTRRALEDAMELAVQAYLQQGIMPDRQTLIEMYYGEPLPPVSLFITSGKFNTFGMPLLETDDTSLYFTVAPSPYLTERQLRAMLYDHLYSRHSSARSNYSDLAKDDFGTMRTFYQTYRETTLGTGVMRNGTWYPLIPEAASP
jgi:tuberculosinol/isotuberculosinol synthase